MARFDPSRIREYYDRNTSAFVTLGQGGGAIHRAVWGPGVRNRDEAFHYVEEQIAALVQRLPDPSATHVVDLGCGVGASLLYLARRLPIRATGITISPIQARLAQQRVLDTQAQDRVVCIEGDYSRLPETLPVADLAYAIESFVHGPDPQAFFREAARLLRAGGTLVICDDFLRNTSSPSARRAVEQFCRGWHVNALVHATQLRQLAELAGFEHISTTDLTPALELGRPRDRVVDIAVTLFGWLPLENTSLGHLIGGSALQKALRHGWIGYDLVVFRRA
jgi:ubiquinone/menaquinone biosynthesis C-methylase UbiE